MKIVNLTSHKITVKIGEKKRIVEPSGIVARVTANEKFVGEIENIPAPVDDTIYIYIVSSMVLGAVKNRNDVFAPDTGATAIRNNKGQIEAVTRLIQA